MDNFYIVARMIMVEGDSPIPVEDQLFPINSWFTPMFFESTVEEPKLIPVKKDK